MKSKSNRNPLLKVIPRVGNILEKPIIGSGKIKRRLKVKNSSRKNQKRRKAFKNIFQRRQELLVIPKSEKNKNPLRFPSASVKIIFNHWNSFGYPFVKHRPVKNKTTMMAVTKLDAIVNGKKYKTNDIINSIDRCYRLLNSEWFKYRIYFNKNKLSLRDFISFSSERWSIVKKFEVPRSWLRECHKLNLNKLKVKYAYVPKDQNVQVTYLLEDIWKQYEGRGYREVDKKAYIDISKKLCDFCEKNKFEKSAIIDIVGRMLNDWKTFKPKHIGFLKNKIFWNDTLPKEIVRYGLADKLEDIK